MKLMYQLDHRITLCLTSVELPNYFPKWLHHFVFPPAMYECSNFSTSSPKLINVCFFDYSHLSGYEMASHFGFDLHFPND